MSKIFWKISKKTGDQKIDKPEFLERGENAEIEFIPQQPIYFEKFDVVVIYGGENCESSQQPSGFMVERNREDIFKLHRFEFYIS